MKYSSYQSRHRRGLAPGFTLVELLVVIAIIVILMAILYPVFQGVRERARQVNCRSNLHQISVALKSYYQDHGRYPLCPTYDGTRYYGGISALFPDYISEKKLLVCPDDRDIDGVEKAAADRVYSSYNGVAEDPATDKWQFKTATGLTNPDGGGSIDGYERTYNYFGFTVEGWDAYDWSNWPWQTGAPSWYAAQGLKYRHLPRLSNRQAPDNTIITHCIHHRQHYKHDQDRLDMIVTVGGDTDSVNVSNMSAAESGSSSKWVTQKQ